MKYGYVWLLLNCRDMKNVVIGNRNQKEKFVQSQIVPKYVNIMDVLIKRILFENVYLLVHQWFSR